jgi:hypothetical protein
MKIHIFKNLTIIKGFINLKALIFFSKLNGISAKTTYLENYSYLIYNYYNIFK